MYEWVNVWYYELSWMGPYAIWVLKTKIQKRYRNTKWA